MTQITRKTSFISHGCNHSGAARHNIEIRGAGGDQQKGSNCKASFISQTPVPSFGYLNFCFALPFERWPQDWELAVGRGCREPLVAACAKCCLIDSVNRLSNTSASQKTWPTSAPSTSQVSRLFAVQAFFFLSCWRLAAGEGVAPARLSSCRRALFNRTVQLQLPLAFFSLELI